MEAGEIIRGKYRLLRLLGDGGMGAVYEASHEQLGTRVAIKVLHPELARKTGLVERFMQEARVAAQIRSPNVVQVTDIDKTPDGIAYIVMELLEGEPLGATLDRQGKLPLAQACDFTRQILLALEAAHALGVVHRDLKPENVFVTYQTTKPVLKLIDFGIAKLRNATSQGGRSLTVAGVLMGTAEYMAPEQAHSADQADARSDIYAVGVMLYEMIAGKRPVAGENARAIAAKVERGEIVPLVHVAPDVPREIAGLVHRAMASSAALRFQSATEMRLALDGAISGKRVPTMNLQAAPISQGPSTVPARPATQVLAASRAPAEMEAAPRTERAGPSPVAFGGGAFGGGAFGGGAVGGGPEGTTPGYYASHLVAAGAAGAGGAAGGTSPGAMPSFPGAAEGRPRKSRRGLWAVIVLLILVVAGVVTALVVDSSLTAPEAARPTLTIAPPVDLTATATPTAPAPPAALLPPGVVAPLTPSPRSGPTGAPSAPHPGGSGHPSPAPSSAPPGDTVFVPTMPTAFPIPFPSMGDGGVQGFPFPFPSALPATFPSTFPFPIPFPTGAASQQTPAPAKSL